METKFSFEKILLSFQDEDLVQGPVRGEQSGAAWSGNTGSVSGQSLEQRTGL